MNGVLSWEEGSVDVMSAYGSLGEYRFVDVREEWEWDLGHIEGARHLPLEHLPDRLEDLPRDKPLVVVCRTGSRSELAAMFMSNQGIEAHNLEGGMVEWDEHRLPYVASDGSPGSVG